MLNVTDQWVISPATGGGGGTFLPSGTLYIMYLGQESEAQGPSAHRSLQQESWKTFFDSGQVWIQDAGDLLVSFYLLGFYLPSITSSLR